ncbi:MAG: chemotaxis protein CheW [Pirellulales bacterium]|nr:chemotaxis protein CheW [Pirellulales bacterium]
MDISDAELIADFVVEAQEGLANIEQQMLAIEEGGADINVELVNAVFRTMHSIKGTAGFLGLDRIGVLAHGLEEVLNRLRNHEVLPSSELVDTILHAADFMEGLIESVETSNEADISQYVESLQQYRVGGEPAVNPASAVKSEESTPPVVSATFHLSEAAREFIIECYDNLDLMDRDLLALEQSPGSTNLLRGIFRTMHTIKGGAGFLGLAVMEKFAHIAETLLGSLRDGDLPFTSEIAGALLAATDKCREGLRLLETTGTDIGFETDSIVQRLLAAQSVCPTGEHARNDAPDLLQSAPPRPSTGPSAPARSAPPTSAAHANTHDSAAETPEHALTDKQQLAAGDSTIRVDVALLDKLMTRVGELVLARNQILQHTNRSHDAEFISTAQRLNLITTELQEGVMKTRMQPIGNVWGKFPRVIRDLASQLGKQIRLEMEGKETELDKTILEAIKDPLTHLVRNSVDHGIESPEARRSVGKPETGCLRLRAYHEGGQVNIEIIDDGAGLNLERIRQKAVEKGIVTADQAARLSDREAAQLILLPGFSTAEKVTNVSGRGVGMDVVKTNIEKIGGTLDLQSQPGRGTTIKIKIPLTLAIIPALIVTTGGDRYAIPQVSLLELVRLEGEAVQRQIEYVHGAPVFRLRSKLLPLINLAERLGLSGGNVGGESPAGDQVVNIVVLRSNDRQYGLVVDKVNDTEEIVVKPLSRQLKGLGEYAGTTIMGDGTVALILDVLGIAMAAGLNAEMREQPHGGPGQADTLSRAESQTLLVVDLGDSRRFALPTSMIARLEKASAAAIEYAHNQPVIQYRGSILPLIELGDVFGRHPDQPERSEQSELQIIVYADQEHHCGFVVNRIVDIVETELNFVPGKPVREHLLGTMVIQERVTDVLNLPSLARHASPRSSAAFTPA